MIPPRASEPNCWAASYRIRCLTWRSLRAAAGGASSRSCYLGCASSMLSCRWVGCGWVAGGCRAASWGLWWLVGVGCRDEIIHSLQFTLNNDIDRGHNSNHPCYHYNQHLPPPPQTSPPPHQHRHINHPNAPNRSASNSAPWVGTCPTSSARPILQSRRTSC